MSNVIPFRRNITAEELEELIMNEEVLPTAEAFLISSVGVNWFHIGKKFEILREAHRRWRLKIWVDTEKLSYGRRVFHFHVQGPAVQVLLFTEMIGKHV